VGLLERLERRQQLAAAELLLAFVEGILRQAFHHPFEQLSGDSSVGGVVRLRGCGLTRRGVAGRYHERQGRRRGADQRGQEQRRRRHAFLSSRTFKPSWLKRRRTARALSLSPSRACAMLPKSPSVRSNRARMY